MVSFYFYLVYIVFLFFFFLEGLDVFFVFLEGLDVFFVFLVGARVRGLVRNSVGVGNAVGLAVGDSEGSTPIAKHPSRRP